MFLCSFVYVATSLSGLHSRSCTPQNLVSPSTLLLCLDPTGDAQELPGLTSEMNQACDLHLEDLKPVRPEEDVRLNIEPMVYRRVYRGLELIPDEQPSNAICGRTFEQTTVVLKSVGSCESAPDHCVCLVTCLFKALKALLPVSYTHRRCRRSTLCRSRWSPYH